MSSRVVARRLSPIGCLALLAGASTAYAAPINDGSFFDGLVPSLIDFETNGAGSPISLIQGQISTMPKNEYSALGVRFSIDLAWANDGNAQMDAAQFLGASPEISMPSSQFNSFTMFFDVPVQAFGFFVANNRVADPNGPVFTAYDANGVVIESVDWSASFIDNGFSLVDYGFMGISSPETLIARVEISKQAAILDDLTFAVIPAPGAGALLGAGAMVLARRRR